MKNRRKDLKGKSIKHPRKSVWWHVVVPSLAYGNFKSLRAEGWYHKHYTWRMRCKEYRKKMRKLKIAKYSRRGLKKRIKRAR